MQRRSGAARNTSLEAFLGEGGRETSEERGAPPPIDALLDSGARPGDPELPAPFARIVRRVFELDVEDAFQRCTDGLRETRRGASRLEYGELVDMLDKASELAMTAAALDAASAVTVARYEADLEVLRSDMRTQAIASLSAERSTVEKGTKSKQITNEDVEARMAGMHPAEYRRLVELLAKARAARGFIKTLPDQWGARRREIEAMLRTSRKL